MLVAIVIKLFIIIMQGLQFVPSLGWSSAALQAGAKEVGYPQTLSGIVPEAGIGLVHHQFKTANDTLELEMQKQVNN
jgi:ubiquinone biosynthesis protein COQ9